MNIMLVTNDIHTLANVVIANLTCANLVSEAIFFLGNGYNDCSSSKSCVIS